MFNTPEYDFNVVNLKGIDIAREYSEACKKYDMKAGYYVSLLDWNHPDYDPSGSGISYPAGNYEAEKQENVISVTTKNTKNTCSRSSTN